MGEADDAASFMAEGDRLMTAKRWLFLTDAPKYQEAADAYSRAGNLYKALKEWHLAGNAFLKAADADVAAGEPEESTRKLLSAASSYKKVAPEKAVELLKRANAVFLKSGRFHMAASHEKEIAEIYETQLGNLESAMQHFEVAADRYLAEDATAAAQACSIKVGTIAALIGRFDKAIEVFEEAAQAGVNDPVRKFGVRDHLFRAGLCQLCSGDMVAAKRAIERYPGIDAALRGTREYRLLTVIVEAIDENDLEKFTDEIAEFDKVGLLDEWKTKLLLRIKRSFAEESSLT